MNTHIKDNYNYLFGLFSFIIYSVSFMIGPDEESANHLFVLIKASLICVSGLLYIMSCKRQKNERIRISHCILSLVIFVYEVLLFIAVGRTILYIRDYPLIINSIVWLSCSLYAVIVYRQDLMAYFRKITNERFTIKLILSSALLAIIVILLSLEPDGIMFSWDSDTLYGFVYNLDYDSLFDAKQLLFWNHISIIYTYLLVLLKLLIGNLRIAFFLVNAFCIITASFGMTFLFRFLFPNRTISEYSLANALFLFSPWVCGMSTYHIYDYYIWCLFPLLICFCVRRNWLGFFTIGVMISFSRAPG